MACHNLCLPLNPLNNIELDTHIDHNHDKTQIYTDICDYCHKEITIQLKDKKLLRNEDTNIYLGLGDLMTTVH